MAISRVQFKAGQAVSGAGTLTFTSATGAGNLIVVLVSQYGAPAAAASVTDSGSHTYTSGYDLTAASAHQMNCFYLANAASITSVSVTPNAGAWSALAIEYSGVATSTPLDTVVAATVNNGAGTTWSSNALTCAAGDLVLGHAYNRTTANASYTATAPWGLVSDFNCPGDGDDSVAIEQVNVSAGSFSAAGGCAAMVIYGAAISFKAGAGGGGTPTTGYLQPTELPLFDRIGLLSYFSPLRPRLAR